MSHLKKKKLHLVLGSGVLLAALSFYGAGDSIGSQSGAVSEHSGTYLTAPRSAVRRARQSWRALRQNIRNGTTATERATEPVDGVDQLTLRSARLTGEHLDVTYALPEPECVSLWMTSAANQAFQRINIIGGMPCPLNSGELSAHLRIDGIQPAVAAGQLMQVCTNARAYCSQPIAVTVAGKETHGAALEPIMIHSAILARNAYLSIVYSKGEGCVGIVRWNGPGNTQTVSHENDSFTCDAADHATARVNIRGMQPLLGPVQWIYLCYREESDHCSNLYRIR